MANQPPDFMVNIAVCGRFHYANYVRYLDALGGLNRFFYSTRVSLNSVAIGINRRKAVNAWAKEYLGAIHGRLLGDRWITEGRALYHDLWQLSVLLQWKKAPILHHMLHGNGRMLINRARSDGSIVIGEPVNSHPDDLRQLLSEEHGRLGLVPNETEDLIDRRLADEATQCDYILAGSNVVKRSFSDRRFPEERIHVIPYGTDTQRFFPLTEGELSQPFPRLRNVRFRVICVAQIIPRKGHVYLLEAWKRLKLSNAELLLIGPLHPRMRPIISKYEGQFTHIPYVPHERLRQFYGRSHVFTLPSLEDGFAYVCTEALGCGIPVITTENTGASELLTDGINGYVVPVRSVEALAERLNELYENEEKCHYMGGLARVKAEQELTWQHYSSRVMKFYQEVMEEKSC